MRLLQAYDINPIVSETTLFSCKVPTQILGKKGVVGIGTACALLNGDVFRKLMNKRGYLEVCW